MRTLSLLVVAFVATGCHDLEHVPAPDALTQDCPKSDMPTCASPDLAPPLPKCKAASGLMGDALICVDFDQPTTTLTDLMAKGWTFVNAPLHPWEIANGKLQVNNFAMFADTGSFKMPLTDLASATNQKYQSVTLAVVQRVDVDQNALPPQTAKLILGQDLAQREFTTLTGKNPRQQNQYTLMRSDLAAVPGVGTNFQPLFKLSSGALYAGVGWQIESIAVMGNP